MNKKSLMIPITIALLLTACQSSGLSRPDIPAQTGTVIQTEETTEAPKTADVPAITAAPETSETAENAAGLELPILDEINNNVTVATAGAIVVVAKICDSCMVSVAAAPLKPYQPNQRINTPRAPISRL